MASMPADTRVAFSTIATEYDYTETMGVKMIKGRDFSRFSGTILRLLLLMSRLLKWLAFEEPIGQKVEWGGGQFEIIGVMQDMVMAEATSTVQPLSMFLIPGWMSTITIRLNKTDDLNAAIAQVESVFKKHNPNYPFWISIHGWCVQSQIHEHQFNQPTGRNFAGLAIAIPVWDCSVWQPFTAEQRTKGWASAK